MKKTVAIKLLGPTAEEAGRRIGCSGAAVRKWPDELPQRLVDRVIAASVRESFTRLSVIAATGLVKLHPDLYSHLWHDELMARAVKARKADEKLRSGNITEHQQELLAKIQRQLDRLQPPSMRGR